MTDLPEVAHAGTIQVGSVTLRTYVLTDCRRIFDAEDIEALLSAWRRGESPTAAEAEEMANFMRGAT